MADEYANYDQIPWYRRNLVAILMAIVPFGWLALVPIVLTGPIYYQRRGEVRQYSIIARIVIALSPVVLMTNLYLNLREEYIRPTAQVAESLHDATPVHSSEPTGLVEYKVLRLFDYVSDDGFRIWTAASINNRGEVIGTARNMQNRAKRGFHWSNGKLTLLDMPDLPKPDVNSRSAFARPPSTEALDINDHGITVGVVRNGPMVRPVIWEPGQPPRLLDIIPDGLNAEASYISNGGVIAGKYYSQGKLNEAFVWNGREFTALGAFALKNNQPVSFPTGMNDSGYVIGRAQSAQGIAGFLWKGESILELGRIAEHRDGETDVSPRGINNVGVVVGCSRQYRAGGGGSIPILWNNDGSVTKLVKPTAKKLGDGDFACAEALNSDGTVVGFINDLDGDAFIWKKETGLRLIGDLVDLVGNNLLRVTKGYAINDRGEILADADITYLQTRISTPILLVPQSMSAIDAMSQKADFQ